MTAMSFPDWMPEDKPAPWPKGKSQRLVGSGQTLYHGGVTCVDPATGKFVKGIGTDPTLVAYGFLEHWADDGIVDNSADAFTEEVFVASDCRLMTFTGTSLTDAHEGATAFIVDDQTMSLSSNSGVRPVGGKILEVVSATSAYVWIHPDLSIILANKTALISSQAQLDVPLASFVDADGDPIAKFSSASSPTYGFTLVDSKSLAIRWNNDATPGTALGRVNLPQDLDDAAPIVLHFLCSKSGATVGDATTLTIAAYFQTVAALHDADADCGGVTNALTGNATAKTVAELTRSIAAADVPPAPCSLTFTVTPTAGLLATDDLLLHACWVEYTRKPLTA